MKEETHWWDKFKFGFSKNQRNQWDQKMEDETEEIEKVGK